MLQESCTFSPGCRFIHKDIEVQFQVLCLLTICTRGIFWSAMSISPFQLTPYILTMPVGRSVLGPGTPTTISVWEQYHGNDSPCLMLQTYMLSSNEQGTCPRRTVGFSKLDWLAWPHRRLMLYARRKTWGYAFRRIADRSVVHVSRQYSRHRYPSLEIVDKRWKTQAASFSRA